MAYSEQESFSALESEAAPQMDGRQWLETVEQINGAFEHHGKPIPAETKHNLADRIRTRPEFLEYRDFRITTDTFRELLNYFQEETSDHPNTQTVEKYRNLLENTIKGIKLYSEQYYTILLSIDRLYTVHKLRMDADEYREIAQQRDSRRRIIHNALIAEIKTLTRICNVLIPKNLDITIPPKYMFTGAEVGNRDFIGKWAFDMEFHRRIADVLEGELE